VHFRSAHRRLRPFWRPSPRSTRSHRPRRRHRQRTPHRPCRSRVARDRPRWTRRRARRPPPARPGKLRLRRAVRVVCQRQRDGTRVSDHLDYNALRADTVRQVAKLMAAAAVTAPKSGGQLFLQGKHLFIETVIVDDHDTLIRLAAWMRARGKERRETIWFRDADVAEAIDAALFVGLADWYPPNYHCAPCAYPT